MSNALPDGFFDRADPTPDPDFYAFPRLVTHIDDAAVAAVGQLYDEVGVAGRVLDLMSSWVSHLFTPPESLTVLGLNADELNANPAASRRVVHDLNADPALPFDDASFDAALCCVSIDYLTQPVEVLADARRVLTKGAPVVITFSNRCFPTKAVRGWLEKTEAGRCAVVVDYLRRADGFTEPEVSRRTPAPPEQGGTYWGDPLYAVVAHRR
ncbi:MAG: methyltransferase domain-containing protein [Humibacillus sp.]|nr:methyltransferase domain-containing protein [Humibacillus sp.]MDN5778175.1 methyltransferase domain-containing protein [Humibacillus sp.]